MVNLGMAICEEHMYISVMEYFQILLLNAAVIYKHMKRVLLLYREFIVLCLFVLKGCNVVLVARLDVEVLKLLLYHRRCLQKSAVWAV